MNFKLVSTLPVLFAIFLSATANPATASSYARLNQGKVINCANFYNNTWLCKAKTQAEADTQCQVYWEQLNFSKNPLRFYTNLATGQRHAILKVDNRHKWAHLQKQVCVINDGYTY
jgi:hypothetical protein